MILTSIDYLLTLTGRSSKQEVRKKYIGDHMPENKEPNDDSTNKLLL